MAVLKDGTKIIESKCFREQFVPTVGEMLKAGHITVVKDAQTSIDAAEVLTKAGYRCSVIEINSGALFDYNSVAVKLVKEESRLVIGIGGINCSESAKVIAGTADLPLLLIPTSLAALCCMQKKADFFNKDTIVSYISAKSATVLFCYDIFLDRRADIPAGLGYMLSYFVWAFDTLYEGLLHNKGMNVILIKLIESIQNSFKKFNNAEAADYVELILKSAIDISTAYAEVGQGSSAAISLAWFISLYKKRETAYTEYSFIAAYMIIELYLAAPCELNMLLPTDRDITFAEIEKCCGLSYRRELRETKIGYAEDYNRRNFVTADYLEELKSIFRGDYLTIAAKCYRRCVGNCGYNMRKIINSDELLRLAALSAEASDGYPLIKHLKLSGILDRYI